MTYEDYTRALKLGVKSYRNAISKGEYPYLPALDELLERVEVQTEAYLGLVDIPLDQIVGTKTAGRQNSFAANFMPLMSENTEFAMKWINLYEHQIDMGVRDPIVAYEFMNKFYVMEGNKRVSVFKYLDSSSIEGTVTRIIPKPTEEPENRIYYEFLDFYKKAPINYIWFTKEGSFARLQKAVGKGPDEVWSEDDKKDFSSVYTEFSRIFENKSAKNMTITTGDAFLLYLSLYPYQKLLQKGRAEMRDDIERLWGEFLVLNHRPETALVMEPSENTERNLFVRFLSTGSRQLRISFIHDKNPQNSSWTYGHELGRMHLNQIFGEQIETDSYLLESSRLDVSALIEAAIEDGSHIIFTTNQKFLEASLKAALEHPEVKILNCSLNRPYRALRTYYGRMYEAKFLIGMIAGAMCENDRIAYAADFPIYGSLANINAFARGAKMTNPRAKIYLNWSSALDQSMSRTMEENKITVISDTDMIRPSSVSRNFGLRMEKNGQFVKLATPIWNWGKFYEKIIRDILKGNWDKGPDVKERKALNYWWGISGNIIDVIFSQNLPNELRILIETMRNEIFNERFHPFGGILTQQNGRMIGTKDSCLSPEEIITM
ncbi:MAG: BMP family ABC transporter substrate-binding protein, partial [Lachnospiraceae bacterium]|nr:BMP family ABC transporter substrate-binding protein [Lachnospiraceae bacterium]